MSMSDLRGPFLIGDLGTDLVDEVADRGFVCGPAVVPQPLVVEAQQQRHSRPLPAPAVAQRCLHILRDGAGEDKCRQVL